MSPEPGVEIERKFVLDAPPADLDQHPSDRIEQGYLAIAEDGVEVRIRRRDDACTLTIKSGPGHVRVEEEIAIDERRFEALWALTEGRRVAKTRYLVPLEDGLEAEVDVYGEALEGLVVAEIEFPSEADSEAFSAPDWLGREVTEDAAYARRRWPRRALPGPRSAQPTKR